MPGKSSENKNLEDSPYPVNFFTNLSVGRGVIKRLPGGQYLAVNRKKFLPFGVTRLNSMFASALTPSWCWGKSLWPQRTSFLGTQLTPELQIVCRQALALRNCLYKGAEDWAGGQKESREGRKQRGDRQWVFAEGRDGWGAIWGAAGEDWVGETQMRDWGWMRPEVSGKQCFQRPKVSLNTLQGNLK